ncbi:MAG: hypothetical protein OXC13_11500 [Caldilineaceae bacterium]|nr:hypothetical protein [Caldilineaceae bacterium]
MGHKKEVPDWEDVTWLYLTVKVVMYFYNRPILSMVLIFVVFAVLELYR